MNVKCIIYQLLPSKFVYYVHVYIELVYICIFRREKTVRHNYCSKTSFPCAYSNNCVELSFLAEWRRCTLQINIYIYVYNEQILVGGVDKLYILRRQWELFICPQSMRYNVFLKYSHNLRNITKASAVFLSFKRIKSLKKAVRVLLLK